MGHTCFSITSMAPGLGLQVLLTPTPHWRGHTCRRTGVSSQELHRPGLHSALLCGEDPARERWLWGQGTKGADLEEERGFAKSGRSSRAARPPACLGAPDAAAWGFLQEDAEARHAEIAPGQSHGLRTLQGASCFPRASVLAPAFPWGAERNGGPCVPGGRGTYISSAERSVWP